MNEFCEFLCEGSPNSVVTVAIDRNKIYLKWRNFGVEIIWRNWRKIRNFVRQNSKNMRKKSQNTSKNTNAPNLIRPKISPLKIAFQIILLFGNLHISKSILTFGGVCIMPLLHDTKNEL